MHDQFRRGRGMHEVVAVCLAVVVLTGCRDRDTEGSQQRIAFGANSGALSILPAVPGLPPPPESILKAQAGVSLPVGFARTEEGRIFCVKDGAEMVLVPAGKFVMGSDGEVAVIWGSGDSPRREMSLGSFLVDRHPVTEGQWKRYLAETGRAREHSVSESGRKSDLLPATRFSFREAERYAAWAGKSIPSEAMWEKAARGTEGRLLPWGDEEKRLPNEDVPVDSQPENASPFGVFAIAGGPNEWCFDRRSEGLWMIPAGPEALNSPMGFFDGRTGVMPSPRRVVRNGYFENILTSPQGIYFQGWVEIPLYTTTKHWRRPLDSSHQELAFEDSVLALRCVRVIEP